MGEAAARVITFAESPESFLQFYNAWDEVDHPNIRRLIGYSGDARMVMLESGYVCTLRNVLGESLPLNARKQIVLDIAAAMCCLHARGFAYAELRPDTVMLRGDWGAQLDFPLPSGPIPFYREVMDGPSLLEDICGLGVLFLEIALGREVHGVDEVDPAFCDLKERSEGWGEEFVGIVSGLLFEPLTMAADSVRERLVAALGKPAADALVCVRGAATDRVEAWVASAKATVLGQAADGGVVAILPPATSPEA